MFLHSVCVQDVAIGADGLFNYDLSVNALSAILIGLRPLNDTGTLANFPSLLEIAGAVNRVSVYFRGESIVSMSGRDAAAMAYFRHGIVPPQANHDNTNNERRMVMLPILMGRFPYDVSSCFPPSRRGELVLELDLDIADTGYDGLRLQVDTIELLDVKPKEYEKKVQLAQTWAATGLNDMDLSPVNDCRGVLLFGTTGFGGATPAPGWGRVQVLVDNQAVGYSAVDFEVAHGLPSLWGRQPPMLDAHKHIVTTDGNAQTELATLAGPYNVGTGGWENYAFLDFDPTRDDAHTIRLKNASRFQIRADAETAEAVRAVPVEVVRV